MRRSPILLIAALFIAVPSVRAQEPVPDAEPAAAAGEAEESSSSARFRDEVTVTTATRSERVSEETPASVTVIDREALDQAQVQTLGDFNFFDPGVSVGYSPGAGGPSQNTRPGYQGWNIRGIDGNRVLFQVDGIRQPEAFTFGGTTSVGRDYVDPETLKRVEILKGSASSLYGSDALGGVVSFTTKDPEDYLPADGRPYYVGVQGAYDGASETASTAATVAFRAGRFSALATATRREGHETETAFDGSANPLDLTSENAFGKLAFSITPAHTLRLAAERLERTQDIDILSARRVITIAPLTGTRVESLNLADRVERDRYSLHHQYRAVGSGGLVDRFDLKLFAQSAETFESSVEERSRVAPALDRTRLRSSDYRQDNLGGSVQLESSRTLGAGRHRFVYGVELEDGEMERNRNGLERNHLTGTTTTSIAPDSFPVKDIPDTDTRRLGVFLQDEVEIGRFTLIPGLRYDTYEIDPTADPIYLATSGGEPPIRLDEEELSPSLGVLYAATRRLGLYGRYAHGFRNPTTEDLNGTVTNLLFGYQTIPNRELRSESSDAFEAGAHWNGAATRVHAAAFYSAYDDFIVPYADGGIDPDSGLQIFISQNLDRAVIYGAEADFDLYLGALSPRLAPWQLFAQAAWARGKDDESGTPLDSVDPLTTALTLRYAPGRYSVDLRAAHAEAPRRLPSSEFLVPFRPEAWTTLDLLGSVRLGRFEVFAGLYNLTDESYWRWQDVRLLDARRSDLGRFAQPGRSFRLGLRIGT